MRRRIRDLLVGVLGLMLVVGVHAGESGPKELRGDLAKIQGTWSTKAGQRGKMEILITIDGHAVLVDIKPPIGPRFKVKGEVSIDESVSPKTLTWSGFKSPDGSEIAEIAAIYRFEGDNWVVCNGGPSNPRPTDFVPGDGVLAQLLTFQRSEEPGTTVQNLAVRQTESR
jgi:uncharacterized protein (TIGR03067 family)